MLLQVVTSLTNKVRLRTGDPYTLATCSLLETLARDIEAGHRKRACKHCRSQYPKELAWSKAWHDRTGYNEKRKAKAPQD